MIYVEDNNLQYFEDYDSHIQEVIIDLIVSILENKRNQQQED